MKEKGENDFLVIRSFVIFLGMEEIKTNECGEILNWNNWLLCSEASSFRGTLRWRDKLLDKSRSNY